MSKKANPTVIGGFVIGAIVCAMAGIMLFGGGSLFDKTFECIVYFDESINGLDVGAPVDFQGVRIGTVTEVRIEFTTEDHGTFYRPVVFQIEGRRFTPTGEEAGRLHVERQLEALVTQGLRARLQNQSLLTGKLKIELGIFPDTAVKRENRDRDYWEMPSISSPLHHVVEEIAHLPLKDIITESHRAIKHMADILDPDAVGETLENMNEVLTRLNIVLTRLDETFDPMADQAHSTLRTAEAALTDIRAAVHALDERVAPFLDSVTETSHHIGHLLDPHSSTRGELTALVQELRNTSRSLRQLTDYLEQYPESLLRGKRH